MEWSEVGWSGGREVELGGVECSGVERSPVEWSGEEWSGAEWREVEWSGVEWSEEVRRRRSFKKRRPHKDGGGKNLKKSKSGSGYETWFW